jgi:beta-lactamase regulating signal transducer with metallopeptidase domain
MIATLGFSSDAVQQFVAGAFAWMLRATWQAGVLAILVLLAIALLRRRLSARGRCLLWSIVLARLLLPPLPEWRPTLWPSLHTPLAVTDAITRPQSPTDRQPSQIIEPQTQPLPTPFVQPHQIDEQRVAELRAELAAMPDDPVDSAMAGNVQPIPPAAPTLASRISTIAAIAWRAAPWLWLGGVVALTARVVWASTRLARAVRKLLPVQDAPFFALARQCAAEMGLRRLPMICAADDLPGPALAGVWRPRLLVPRHVLASFPQSELRLMLLHELAHVRRRDVLANWLLYALQVLHWFNPVLRAALRRARADRELACDETVLATSRRGSRAAALDDRRAYGHALLRLAEHFSCAPAPAPAALPAAGAVGILEDQRHLERRIVMILRFNPTSSRWPAIVAGGALLLAGIALTDAAEPAAAPKPAPAQAAQTAAESVRPASSDVATALEGAPPAADVAAGAPVAGEGLAPPPAVPGAADPRAADEAKILEFRLQARQAELNMMEARLARAKQAYEAGAATASEVEEAQAQIAKSKADVAEAEYLVQRAKRGATGGLTGAVALRGDIAAGGGGGGGGGGIVFDPNTGRVWELKVAQKEAELKRANSQYERMRALASQNDVSAAELDRVEAELAKAKAELEEVRVEAERYKAGRQTTTSGPEGGGVAFGGGLGGGTTTAGRGGIETRDGTGRGRGGFGGGFGGGGGIASAAPAHDDSVVQDADAQRLDAQTAERLRKPMKLHLNSGDLQTAIQSVREATGVDIIVDRTALGSDAFRGPPQVDNLFIEQPTPAAQVLTWILRNAGGDSLGYAIDQGAVLISTRAQLDRLTVTRVYDVADLMVMGHESAESVGDLIAAVVAPGSWGRIRTIRQFGSRLLITQTQPNHAQVEKLLSLLRTKASSGPRGRGGGGGGGMMGPAGDGAVNPAGDEMAPAGGEMGPTGIGSGMNPIFNRANGSSEAQAKAAAARGVSLNHMRQILLAAIAYAGQHDGELPRHFPDDIRSFLAGNSDDCLANPRIPGKKIGYVWTGTTGKLSDLPNPSTTVLLQEAEDVRDGFGLGYADGHVEFVRRGAGGRGGDGGDGGGNNNRSNGRGNRGRTDGANEAGNHAPATPDNSNGPLPYNPPTGASPAGRQ